MNNGIVKNAVLSLSWLSEGILVSSNGSKSYMLAWLLI